jgi:hypothetical protein
LEQHNEALAAVHAFDKAAGVPLWERFSPLHPRATDHELQAALVAKLTEAEQKAWQRYVRQWQKERDAEQAEDRKQEKTPSAETPPRPDNLRWGGHW